MTVVNKEPAGELRLFDDCYRCGWRIYSDPPAGWDHLPRSQTDCTNPCPRSIDQAWRHLVLTFAVTLRLDRLLSWLVGLQRRDRG